MTLAGFIPAFESEDTWDVIDAAIGQKLTDEDRCAIYSAAQFHLVRLHFSELDSAKRRMRGRLDQENNIKDGHPYLAMCRAMDSMVRAWTQLEKMDGGKAVLNDYDSNLSQYSLPLLELMKHVQFHRISMRLFQKNSSNSNYRGYSAFILKLSEVYSRITGKPPRSSISHSSDELRLSPFIKFVQAVDGSLPSNGRRVGATTPEAWAAAIKRALQKGRQVGESPQPGVP